MVTPLGPPKGLALQKNSKEGQESPTLGHPQGLAKQKKIKDGRESPTLGPTLGLARQKKQKDGRRSPKDDYKSPAPPHPVIELAPSATTKKDKDSRKREDEKRYNSVFWSISLQD